MDAPASQGKQARGGHRTQRLAFARGHFSQLPARHHEASQNLHIEGALRERTLRGFAHERKYLDFEILFEPSCRHVGPSGPSQRIDRLSKLGIRRARDRLSASGNRVRRS